MIKQVKLQTGGYKYPVTLDIQDTKIMVSFGFNRGLINEIKSMEGARWHPETKNWSIKNSDRNWFQLSYLMGDNPYAQYDAPLIEYKTERPLRDHQITMVRHALTRKQCVFAAEMGTGKTLSAIEVVEHLSNQSAQKTGTPYGEKEVWYIGPVAGVRAVRRELIKWDCKVKIKMMTYDRLTDVIKNWPGGAAPKIVIFDESSKIKTPSAQRSQAALHLACSVRAEHPEDGYVILMSGTPAPKTPLDWWHQCEVACPGFLKEGTIQKLRFNLAYMEQRENMTGGQYNHLIGWKDSEDRCERCGLLASEHDVCSDHNFTPGKNEVARLYKRMQGLVLTIFKKDCLDLPEKQYRIIQIKPTIEIIRNAQMITKTAKRAVTALSLLRELSDGFQYATIKTEDLVECPVCHGSGVEKVPVESDLVAGPLSMEGTDGEILGTQALPTTPMELVDATCRRCDGTGEVFREERIAKELGSPKDHYLVDLLDEHQDVGRIIIWAGFTGSLDRIAKLCLAHKWAVLRVDGRGYKGTGIEGELLNAEELLEAMDASGPRYEVLRAKYPNIAFVGHPKAGGMALTLTASPTEIFYSNAFDGEARIQAEDRFHRLGMDENRGATIIDLIMLPSDLLVLENLKKKKRLQSMTMGEMNDAWACAANEMEKYSYDE